MTVLARRVGDDVRGRLSGSLDAVMTGRAGAQRLRMIKVLDRLEVVRNVAVAALLRRRDVRGRDADRSRTVVARAAFSGRTGELAALVTGLAGDVAMRA